MSPLQDPRFTQAKKAELVQSNDTVKSELLKPAILAAIGGTVITVYLVIQGGPAFAAVGGVYFLIGIGIQIVAGLLALLIASSLLSTGAGPLGLACLRLAGCFIFTNAAGIFFGMLGCAGIVLNLILLGMLINWLFDFEGTESLIIVIILFFIYLGAAIFTFFKFVNAMFV